MHQRLKTWLVVSLCSVFAAKGIGGLFAGDVVGSIVWWSLLLGPLAIVMATRTRAAWLAILLGVSTVWSGLPVVFVERYSIAHLLVVGLFAVLVIGAAIGHRNPQVWRGGGLAFAVVFGVILLRIAVAPPGSARMGPAGGVGEAVLFVLGGIAFWVAAVCMQSITDWRSTMRWMTVTTLVGWVIETGVLFYNDRNAVRPLGPLYFAFIPPVWLLCSALVAWRAAWQRRDEKGGPDVHPAGTLLTEVGAVLLPVALSATSPHRSRPVFALALILSISWVFRRFWRSALLVTPALTLALLLAAWKGSDVVPEMTRRAFSILVPTFQSALPEGIEVGWESEFRATMYHLAWMRIREQPVVGGGFAFKTREMEALSHWSSVEQAGRGLDRLALAGGYHNAVLELAVTCGIPVAVLFLAATLTLACRYAFMIRRCATSWEKVFGATLLGYWLTVTGQLLMNGSGQQFFVVCLLMGTMHGMALARRESTRRIVRSPASIRESCGGLLGET